MHKPSFIRRLAVLLIIHVNNWIVNIISTIPLRGAWSITSLGCNSSLTRYLWCSCNLIIVHWGGILSARSSSSCSCISLILWLINHLLLNLLFMKLLSGSKIEIIDYVSYISYSVVTICSSGSSCSYLITRTLCITINSSLVCSCSITHLILWVLSILHQFPLLEVISSGALKSFVALSLLTWAMIAPRFWILIDRILISKIQMLLLQLQLLLYIFSRQLFILVLIG